MNRIPPKVGVVLAVIMAVLSYYVSVDNFIEDDIQNGVLLAIIGVFFTRTAVVIALRIRSERAEPFTGGAEGNL